VFFQWGEWPSFTPVWNHNWNENFVYFNLRAFR
jgi:hypothetical protein